VVTDSTIRERSRRTLEAAADAFEKDPPLANTVWYGRVLGFRYRIEEAIAVSGGAGERTLR